ncbi:hypothetical protein K439DRAFT_1623561 [Ramaria rubella]|nr:hypothetical protein K439DRAFT_1623561 [Ramaria rubella]
MAVETTHGQSSPTIPSLEEEWNTYCHAPGWPDITEVNLPLWWDQNEDKYLTICITPDLMEKLKYLIKKSRLDFTTSWSCVDGELEMENDNQDVGYGVPNREVDKEFEGLKDIIDSELSDDKGTKEDEDDEFNRSF